MSRALLALLLAVAACSVRAAPERVTFPALAPFQGRSVELQAFLYRPEGPGPFPAVVMLHGCGGMYTSRGELTAAYQRWAALSVGAGYVTLLVDSFTPRGERSICAQIKRTILERRERADDAYAALDWLASRADVDASRVALAGWSNGASGTLRAMEKPRTSSAFAAAVAFYPGCAVLARQEAAYKPYAPLTMLIGEADDWTPAEPCRALTERARKAGAVMNIVTYPGAYHSFDRIGVALRYRADVRNSNKPGNCCGATVGEDPAARLDAESRFFEFLATTLGTKRAQ